MTKAIIHVGKLPGGGYKVGYFVENGHKSKHISEGFTTDAEYSVFADFLRGIGFTEVATLNKGISGKNDLKQALKQYRKFPKAVKALEDQVRIFGLKGFTQPLEPEEFKRFESKVKEAWGS